MAESEAELIERPFRAQAPKDNNFFATEPIQKPEDKKSRLDSEMQHFVQYLVQNDRQSYFRLVDIVKALDRCDFEHERVGTLRHLFFDARGEQQ